MKKLTLKKVIRSVLSMLFALAICISIIPLQTVLAGNGNISISGKIALYYLGGDGSSHVDISEDTTVSAGTVVYITAATNYQIDSVTVTDTDSTAVTVTGNSFTMPEKAVTVSAVCSALHIVQFGNAENDNNGTVTASYKVGSGDAVSIESGVTAIPDTAVVTVSVTPNSTYQVNAVMIDGSASNLTAKGNDVVETTFTISNKQTSVIVSYTKKTANSVTGTGNSLSDPIVGACSISTTNTSGAYSADTTYTISCSSEYQWVIDDSQKGLASLGMMPSLVVYQAPLGANTNSWVLRGAKSITTPSTFLVNQSNLGNTDDGTALGYASRVVILVLRTSSTEVYYKLTDDTGIGIASVPVPQAPLFSVAYDSTQGLLIKSDDTTWLNAIDAGSKRSDNSVYVNLLNDSNSIISSFSSYNGTSLFTKIDANTLCIPTATLISKQIPLSQSSSIKVRLQTKEYQWGVSTNSVDLSSLGFNVPPTPTAIVNADGSLTISSTDPEWITAVKNNFSGNANKEKIIYMYGNRYIRNIKWIDDESFKFTANTITISKSTLLNAGVVKGESYYLDFRMDDSYRYSEVTTDQKTLFSLGYGLLPMPSSKVYSTAAGVSFVYADSDKAFIQQVSVLTISGGQGMTQALVYTPVYAANDTNLLVPIDVLKGWLAGGKIVKGQYYSIGVQQKLNTPYTWGWINDSNYDLASVAAMVTEVETLAKSAAPAVTELETADKNINATYPNSTITGTVTSSNSNVAVAGAVVGAATVNDNGDTTCEDLGKVGADLDVTVNVTASDVTKQDDLSSLGVSTADVLDDASVVITKKVDTTVNDVTTQGTEEKVTDTGDVKSAIQFTTTEDTNNLSIVTVHDGVASELSNVTVTTNDSGEKVVTGYTNKFSNFYLVKKKTITAPVAGTSKTAVSSNVGKTCQQAGYPAGYYWSEEKGMCIISARNLAHIVPNTADKNSDK